MRTVTVTMEDDFTGEEVVRTIDATNAYSSGDITWELKDKFSQKKNLNRWINERANEQHNTLLTLISWEFN